MVRTAARARRRAGVVAWLGLALAGCASLQSGPRDAADDAPRPPAAWAAAASAPAVADDGSAVLQWWRRFDDPLLSQLIADADAHNTDVRSAQARVRQAAALRAQAAAALSPVVAATASAQASRREGQRTTTRSVGGALDADLSPDLSGGVRAAIAAADADADASRALLAQTRALVAAEVALAYVDLRSAQQRLAIAGANLGAQDETLQISRWRAQAGLVSALDSDQAESAAAQTRAQLPAFATAVDQNAHAIALLTGRPAADLLPELRRRAALPQPPVELPASVPAEVLRRRPDVIAAEARVRAAAARTEAADAERLPSLSLGGSIGLNAATLSGLGSGAGLASLAATVRLPLLDGGRIRAQVQGQEAAWDQARSDHRAAVLGALRDVEDALVAIAGVRAQRDELQTALAAARRAAELADARYAAGLVDFLTVLTTRRTLLAIEDNAAGTAAQLASLHVRLYQALGGGWTP
jgi:NodT family efflux transporter outer membrane factor (OMF) lipoprotein